MYRVKKARVMFIQTFKTKPQTFKTKPQNHATMYTLYVNEITPNPGTRILNAHIIAYQYTDKGSLLIHAVNFISLLSLIIIKLLRNHQIMFNAVPTDHFPHLFDKFSVR
jgi:hypothetical protein